MNASTIDKTTIQETIVIIDEENDKLKDMCSKHGFKNLDEVCKTRKMNQFKQISIILIDYIITGFVFPLLSFTIKSLFIGILSGILVLSISYISSILIYYKIRIKIPRSLLKEWNDIYYQYYKKYKKLSIKTNPSKPEIRCNNCRDKIPFIYFIASNYEDGEDISLLMESWDKGILCDECYIKKQHKLKNRNHN